MNSRRWKRLRASYLSLHPLCEACEINGLTTPATEIHHVVPIESKAGRSDDMHALAFDPNNLKALCKACHVEAHRVLHSSSLEVANERKRHELEAFARAYLSNE